MYTTLRRLYTYWLVEIVLSDRDGRRRRQRWDTKVISGRISPGMYEAVIKVIGSGSYVDVTDYLRDLVRKDLEARGISIEDA